MLAAILVFPLPLVEVSCDCDCLALGKVWNELVPSVELKVDESDSLDRIAVLALVVAVHRDRFDRLSWRLIVR